MSGDRLDRIATSGRPPAHVAVVMDGNGRWAERRGLPRQAGHWAGMKAVREAVEGACAAGVEALTLFAFSTENWTRPQPEVDALMKVLRSYARSERDELAREGVEVRVLGQIERLDSRSREAARSVERATRGGRALRLNLMVSYGAREEIARAARILARRVERGLMSPEDVDESAIEGALYTAGVVPDPDLVIRTSGEFRLSNFLLWQVAYSELHVAPVLWPDFTRDDLYDAILDYQARERRFGRVASSDATPLGSGSA